MENILIPTIHLFPILEEKLISLLQSLTPEEWNKPTVAKLWTVKDVAAHLLDGNMRVISMNRDQYSGEKPGNIQYNDDLTAFLNRLNADFVSAMKRVSPALLIELMQSTGRQYTEIMMAADLMAPAPFAVSWAGEENSINWFHIAREYTERWHHQQQIRDAVNKPGILTQALGYPVMDTFMRALPFTYRNINAKESTIVQVSITGEAGGDWFLIKKDRWVLDKTNQLPVDAHTIIDGNIAWKLFTKSWRRKDVVPYVKIEGDNALGEVALDMISVMA